MTYNQRGSPSKIHLIFRFDDYSEVSHTEFERTLLALLERYNIPCTFGVVPFAYANEWDPLPQIENHLSQEKITLLKPFVENGLVEVALHGFHHNTQAKRLNGHIPGEFFGISLEEQGGMVKRGKDYLEEVFSTPVRTFIPPWNTYDEMTLTALVDLGFTCISTGPRFGPIISDRSLSYIPALCKITNLRSVIEKVQNIKSEKAWIVVWFHEYDFLEVSPDRALNKLDIGFVEDLFSWIGSQADIATMTLGQAILHNREFSSARHYCADRLRRYIHLTPPYLRFLQVIPEYYPSRDWLSSKYFQWRAAIFSYYAVLFILGITLMRYLTIFLTGALLNLIGASLGLCIAGILIFILRSRKIYYRSLSILIFSTGFLFGIILKLFIS